MVGRCNDNELLVFVLLVMVGTLTGQPQNILILICNQFIFIAVVCHVTEGIHM